MKIRNGFVSNSSSSSFVAFGRNLNIEDITEEMVHSKEIVALGSYLYDGIDLITISDEHMLKFFKLYKNYSVDGDSGRFHFFEVIKSNEEGFKIEKSELMDNETYEIISHTVDQNSCNDIEELFKRYTEIKSDNYVKIIEQLYREKKLERINK